MAYDSRGSGAGYTRTAQAERAFHGIGGQDNPFSGQSFYGMGRQNAQAGRGQGISGLSTDMANQLSAAGLNPSDYMGYGLNQDREWGRVFNQTRAMRALTEAQNLQRSQQAQTAARQKQSLAKLPPTQDPNLLGPGGMPMAYNEPGRMPYARPSDESGSVLANRDKNANLPGFDYTTGQPLASGQRGGLPSIPPAGPAPTAINLSTPGGSTAGGSTTGGTTAGSASPRAFRQPMFRPTPGGMGPGGGGAGGRGMPGGGQGLAGLPGMRGGPVVGQGGGPRRDDPYAPLAGFREVVGAEASRRAR